MSFPRYPKYKDSGVEWLGQIPEHWKLVPVWLLFELGRGRVISHEEITDNQGEFPVYSSQTEGSGSMGSLNSYDFDGDYLTWTTDGANAGTVFRRSGRFNCTNVCGTLKSRSSNLLLDYCWHALAISTAAFVRYDINPKLMNNIMSKIRIPIPTFPEQTAIAAFLDQETAKIDELVAEQKKLMELLKEKRQAVISHAVTKGLNPNAPMKPSGIEWLGNVPRHWEVKPIRRVITTPLSNGIFKKKEEFGEGVLLVNVFDIYRPDFKVDFISLDRVKCDSGEMLAYEVLSGDLLFVRSSLKQDGIAMVAIVGVCSEPVVYECHLIRARPNRQELDGRFGSYVLNSTVYRSTMIAKAKITTMTTIDQEAILSTQLPIPPLLEQVNIATVLDHEIAQFDTLTAEAQRAIDLLQERRTALISAAVTGQIDVRSQASAAPYPRSRPVNRSSPINEPQTSGELSEFS